MMAIAETGVPVMVHEEERNNPVGRDGDMVQEVGGPPLAQVKLFADTTCPTRTDVPGAPSPIGDMALKVHEDGTTVGAVHEMKIEKVIQLL